MKNLDNWMARDIKESWHTCAECNGTKEVLAEDAYGNEIMTECWNCDGKGEIKVRE